ncbi:hypothetical protein GWK47_020423 [Chionoecetes opilio]|uniref:Uncharacterized protein n=1 Tax=Chionoecetes opilio TaxID=41210 RepID=A0A8J5CKV8_CHIOP|nr:hypothetical protein GWK47_020423 [Chionoecetes opilio]
MMLQTITQATKKKDSSKQPAFGSTAMSGKSAPEPPSEATTRGTPLFLWKAGKSPYIKCNLPGGHTRGKVCSEFGGKIKSGPGSQVPPRPDKLGGPNRDPMRRRCTRESRLYPAPPRRVIAS